MERSYIFLFNLATKYLFPDLKVIIEHSYHKSLYGRFKDYIPTIEDLSKIEEKMREIAEEDISIKKEVHSRESAIKLFEERQEKDKIGLLKYYTGKEVILYHIDDYYEYSYLPVVPSTGYLKTFALKLYQPGFLIILPEDKDINKVAEFKEVVKLFQAFYEYKNWLSILGLNNVSSLNSAI
ncbi:MAG TPA: nucleoside kinase, partial [bacterium]|nr:nucleoside kinase [bacterium]